MHAMNHSLERDVTPLYQWLSRAGAVGCPHGHAEPHPESVYPLRGILGSPLCGLPMSNAPQNVQKEALPGWILPLLSNVTPDCYHIVVEWRQWFRQK